jgi:hypothetical protein
MFSKTAPVAEPARDESSHLEPLVPLSVLELDLDPPTGGWAHCLADRHIEIVLDDLGRAAISRDAAKQLFAEKREAEAEQARKREDLERRLVEQDQLRRAQIWGGIPANMIPDGVSAAQAMAAADRAARPRRRSVLEDSLSNKGTVFHPIQHEAGES